MTSLLNCIRSRPESVRNLVLASALLKENATEERIKDAIYLPGSEHRDTDHWSGNREAAVSLGLLSTNGNVLACGAANGSVASRLDYSRTLRTAFADAFQLPGSENANLYEAYRAALGVNFESATGATAADDLLNAIMRRLGQGSGFNGTKLVHWRNWMEAVGLGFSAGAAFAPVPAEAIADVLTLEITPDRMTVREFVDLLEPGVPLFEDPVIAVRTFPAGVSVALYALEEDGIIDLDLVNDADEQWTLTIPHPSFSHVQVKARS